jgi:transposase
LRSLIAHAAPRHRISRHRDLIRRASQQPDKIALAEKRFGLPEEARVVSCYEAGRDGFWLHRWLTSVGVCNHVVDSSSIEVNRKKCRAKNDHLDAIALVRLLVRYLGTKWDVELC